MTIFVCEILVKWYHGFFMFWKMGWNVLDFFIVVALLLGPCEFKTTEILVIWCQGIYLLTRKCAPPLQVLYPNKRRTQDSAKIPMCGQQSQTITVLEWLWWGTRQLHLHFKTNFVAVVIFRKKGNYILLKYCLWSVFITLSHCFCCCNAILTVLSTGSGSRGVLRILRVLRAFRSLRR